MPPPPDPPDFTHTLLLRAHSPPTATRIHTDRATHKPLLLRASSPQPTARTLRAKARYEHKARSRKRSKLKPRPLSAAQKRKLCLYEIPKAERKYALYEGLHRLWVGYVREILGLGEAEGSWNGEGAGYVTPMGAGPMIASADMHGAVVEVVRSRCVSRVGVKGIVVRDSKFVFEVITRDSVIKTIPKEHTIFRLEVPRTMKEEGAEEVKPLIFEINGEWFQKAAPSRANMKFKMHYQPDL